MTMSLASRIRVVVLVLVQPRRSARLVRAYVRYVVGCRPRIRGGPYREAMTNMLFCILSQLKGISVRVDRSRLALNQRISECVRVRDSRVFLTTSEL